MRHGAVHRFLIIRLGSLGDVVHGIPVAAALRERFPSGRIDWMVDPRYVELLEHVQGIDGIVPLNPRRVSTIATLRMLRQIGYTAVLDLQGLIKSAALAQRYGGEEGRSFDSCYHKACDTVANIDFGILDQMADAAAVVAVRLAG